MQIYIQYERFAHRHSLHIGQMFNDPVCVPELSQVFSHARALIAAFKQKTIQKEGSTTIYLRVEGKEEACLGSMVASFMSA